MNDRTQALAEAADLYAEALLAQRAAGLTYEACKSLPPAERALTMSDAMQRWRAAMDRLNVASAAILRAAALEDGAQP